LIIPACAHALPEAGIIRIAKYSFILYQTGRENKISTEIGRGILFIETGS